MRSKRVSGRVHGSAEAARARHEYWLFWSIGGLPYAILFGVLTWTTFKNVALAAGVATGVGFGTALLYIPIMRARRKRNFGRVRGRDGG